MTVGGSRAEKGRPWIDVSAVLAGFAILGGVGCGPDRPAAQSEAAASEQRTVAGEDSAAPAEVTVFDETADPDLPGRLTFHVLVQELPNRERLSRTMRDMLPFRAVEDPSLVAIRAVMYYPVVEEGASEGNLAPVAWAEWIPLEGWAGDVGGGRGTNHRVYFYFGTPPEW